MIKYRENQTNIFLVDLRDLISSKVEFLSGKFSILFDSFDILGLYVYDSFSLECYYDIRKIGGSFLVKLNIRSSIPVFCDICGEKFNYHFSLDVEEIFTEYFEYKKNFHDMYYFIFNGHELDVGKICIDNFISNLPIKFENGCKNKS